MSRGIGMQVAGAWELEEVAAAQRDRLKRRRLVRFSGNQQVSSLRVVSGVAIDHVLRRTLRVLLECLMRSRFLRLHRWTEIMVRIDQRSTGARGLVGER